MAKFEFLKNKLTELKNEDMLRQLVTIESLQGPVVTIEGSEKIVFCSNNYLNLATEQRVTDAVVEAVRKFGASSGASRLLSGTMKPHVELEQSFADLFGTEASLYFTSGWTANQAVITTIPQKDDIVLIDKLDHASIIDAARSGRAQFRTFKTTEKDKLEKYLADPAFERKFIVTESVFSMDGNTADLKGLVELKNAYDAILIVDEAHAVGCLGRTGAGLAEQVGVLDKIDIIVAPLGKAVAATGAIVAANKTVIDYLINKARGFIFTTAPSPGVCAGAIRAIDIIRSEPERRDRLNANAEYLRNKFRVAGLNIGDSTTYIIPVIIGSAADALSVSKRLYDKGFFVPAIRPPTVPSGSSRLRISVQAEHTKEQMDALAEALKEFVQ